MALTGPCGSRALGVVGPAALCVSTINQRRFMNSYSIAHVLLLAWLMREAYEFARVRFSRRPTALKAAAGIGIALFTASFVPSFEVYRPNLDNILMALQGKPPTIADQRGLLTVNAARWLGRNSPEVDGAGYSVMGAWGDGHILKYAAQRPVVQDISVTMSRRKTSLLPRSTSCPRTKVRLSLYSPELVAATYW